MSAVTLNEESQSLWQSENREHLRYEYDLSPSDVVIDIGAHEGEFSQKIFDKYQCKVIAIEPTGYIEKFTDGEIIQKAASDYDGEQSFGGLSLYTSIFEPAAHRYPCFDICTLLEKYSDIGLVKVNIEGGEYRLLKHILASGMEKRIRNLQIQFHLIEGQPCERWYMEIAEELASTHVLTWQYPYCWESWRRL
jgi:FkbM family methyltransferase